MLLRGRTHHHTTVLPVEYAHVQTVCYVKLLTEATHVKHSRSCGWPAASSTFMRHH